VSLDSLEIRGDAGENSSPVVTNKVRAMSGLRKGILLDEWVIPLDSIRVEVYDNGVIDGDLISIVVNGEVRLSKVKLTDKPIGFDLFAHDLSGYTIEFFAENLGEIPPNTGLVVIRNGQFRRELTFSSDYKSSSYVKIRLAGIRND
jgi:hypothetical protein